MYKIRIENLERETLQAFLFEINFYIINTYFEINLFLKPKIPGTIL